MVLTDTAEECTAGFSSGVVNTCVGSSVASGVPASMTAPPSPHHCTPGATIRSVSSSNSSSAAVTTLSTGVMSMPLGSVGSVSMAGSLADVNASTNECTCEESWSGNLLSVVT